MSYNSKNIESRIVRTSIMALQSCLGWFHLAATWNIPTSFRYRTRCWSSLTGSCSSCSWFCLCYFNRSKQTRLYTKNLTENERWKLSFASTSSGNNYIFILYILTLDVACIRLGVFYSPLPESVYQCWYHIRFWLFVQYWRFWESLFSCLFYFSTQSTSYYVYNVSFTEVLVMYLVKVKYSSNKNIVSIDPWDIYSINGNWKRAFYLCQQYQNNNTLIVFIY